MGCGVCARRDRRKINSDLLTGESLSTVSAKYSIPKTTLHRHVTNCLHSRIGVSRPPPPAVKAAPAPPPRPIRSPRTGSGPSAPPLSASEDRTLVSALTGVTFPSDLDGADGADGSARGWLLFRAAFRSRTELAVSSRHLRMCRLILSSRRFGT